MVQHEEKQIGETTYRVTQLGAKRGRALLVRLFKIAGPALGELLKNLDVGEAKGTKKETVDLGDIPLEAVAGALETLSLHVSEAEFAFFCDELAARTELVLEGGERVVPLGPVFDNHFAGRYGELFRWLAFALWVNYRDFFGGSTGGALLASLAKTTKTRLA